MTKCRRGETSYTIGSSPEHCMIFKDAFGSTRQRIKDRFTVMLMCNMTERIKMKPLIISKYIASRYLEKLRSYQLNIPVLPVHE
jgi:hypothetical protein